MSLPWVVVLVLLGSNLVTLFVMGLWVMARGQQLEKAQEAACLLRHEVGRLQRDADTSDFFARVKELSGEDLAAEFNRRNNPNPGGGG